MLSLSASSVSGQTSIKMKRSHSDTSTSLLPVVGEGDPRKFKSVLEGNYELRVIKASDVSKPNEKPIEDIEEPEEEELANEKRLNQNNARMIQVTLRDSKNTEINALETERIELLTNLKPNWKISIEGPVEVRCGNLMLCKRHVTSIHPPSEGEVERQAAIPEPTTPDEQAALLPPKELRSGCLDQPQVVHLEDWDEEDEEDCIILD